MATDSVCAYDGLPTVNGRDEENNGDVAIPVADVPCLGDTAGDAGFMVLKHDDEADDGWGV